MTTTILTYVAIYFVLWWLCLFIVLPFGGNQSRVHSDDVARGMDPGAPALFRFWPKLLITTVASAALLALVMWGLSNPVLQEYWS